MICVMKYIFVITIIVTFAFNLSAQNVPSLINYQGFITDKDGKALDGDDFKITFSLYDRLEGGDPLWQETHDPVTVENGMLNILLGSVDSTFNKDVLGGKRYLGIKVGGDDSELSPRMQLASVPYSLQTDHSANADSAAHAVKANKALALDAPDGGPENAVYVDNDGNIEVVGRIKDKTGFIMPVGTILPFAGIDSTGIEGWLICDGSAISRTEYSDLFEIINIAYGGGDGVATFNLPNLQGRIPVGLNSGQPEFNTAGKTGGARTHTLTVQEMPSHNHNEGGFDIILINDGKQTPGSIDNTGNEPNVVRQGHLQPAGGGQAHNNLQPYIVMNYIIKY